MRINIFYITVILLGIALYFLFQPQAKEDLSFFGFAENLETEINYNYPVVIDKILVQPGQHVVKGDTLVKLYRQQRRESLQDQEFKIATLKAEETLWKERKRNQLEELKIDQQNKLERIDSKIIELQKELDYKKSVISQLESIKIEANTYQPLEAEIKVLEAEKQQIQQSTQQKTASINNELEKGLYPYQSKISLLKAEKEFEEDQKIQNITVQAPADGLIGTISCKEEEHIPSFKPLLTFYEPHSSMVKGYLHEDLILEVNLGDELEVASLKTEMVKYKGQVVGLGSRIVEIPSRMRKLPEVKTYGREILIEIPTDNEFLQKEKVSLRFISNPIVQ